MVAHRVEVQEVAHVHVRVTERVRVVGRQVALWAVARCLVDLHENSVLVCGLGIRVRVVCQGFLQMMETRQFLASAVYLQSVIGLFGETAKFIIAYQFLRTEDIKNTKHERSAHLDSVHNEGEASVRKTALVVLEARALVDLLDALDVRGEERRDLLLRSIIVLCGGREEKRRGGQINSDVERTAVTPAMLTAERISLSRKVGVSPLVGYEATAQGCGIHLRHFSPDPLQV